MTEFEIRTRNYVDGQAEHEILIQKANKLYDEFVERIKATRPRFELSERSARKPDGRPADEDRAKSTVSGLDILQAVCDMFSADAHQQQVEDDVVDMDISLEELMKNWRERMFLDDMKRHLESCQTRELPFDLPPAALLKLIKRSLADWEMLSSELLDDVRPVVQGLVECWIKEIFGKYQFGGLPDLVSSIVKEQIQAWVDETHKHIKIQIELELRPFTKNKRYIEDSCAKYLAELKEGRAPLSVTDPDVRRQALAQITSGYLTLGHANIGEEDVGRALPTDEYETELNLMAKTYAYWTVAFKRVIHNIPRIIDHQFLIPLAGKAQKALYSQLKLSGEGAEARCKGYLGEDPMEQDHRADLTIRRDRLSAAKNVIKEYHTK